MLFRSWCQKLFTLPSVFGSLCARSFSRHCELLGASVAQAAQSLHSVPTPRDCLRHRALGSLGGKSFLRHCSLLGALVLFSVDGGSWGSSWGPFGALLEPPSLGVFLAAVAAVVAATGAIGAAAAAAAVVVVVADRG